MTIDLASVGVEPKKIDVAFDRSEIDFEGENATLAGDVLFKGETYLIDGKVHIRGNMNAEVSVDCTRCLEPAVKYIDVSFDDVFVDAAQESKTSETEVGIENLNESLVQEGRIELAEVIREQILLALPDQVFCREDCKGLCPKCGANLNLIDCKCADDGIDPRWAALKKIANRES